MKLKLVLILLIFSSSIQSQVLSSHPTDSSKVCIDKQSFKNILEAAYDNDAAKLEVRACELKLVNANQKIHNKNTFLKILGGFALAMSFAFYVK